MSQIKTKLPVGLKCCDFCCLRRVDEGKFSGGLMIRRVARGKRQGEGGEQAGYGCTCVVCCGCGGRTSIPCGCTCACLRTSYPAHRPREICHQANPSKQPSNSQQVVTIWNGLRRQIAQAAGSQPLTCRSDRSSPGRLSCVDHLVEMEPPTVEEWWTR